LTELADKARKKFYRETAIRSAEAASGEGDLLRLSPEWTRPAYWVLIAFFLSGFAYCIFGTIYEYASGPAVVWVTGRTNVTATVAGTVDAIDARPGQRVEAGAVLARFYSAREEAELTRLQKEFELQLVKSLRDPSDLTAREALTALRTQRDLATARIDQLFVKAPQAGIVGDVRIRLGQRLAEGDIVVTLVGEKARYSVMAMLPAQYRPQLRSGMSVRFEVTGYRYAYQEMTITSVGEQIIGPGEVRRYLGPELDDTVTVTGPIVLVEATPQAPRFKVDGRVYPFYHGMSGTVEARVRAESIAFALIPGIRVLLQSFHGKPSSL